LKKQFEEIVRRDDADPDVERSLRLLYLLTGDEETRRIQAELHQSIIDVTKGDNGPPIP
jgi:hypothetical protein